MADDGLREKVDALRDLISVQFAEREKLHDSALQSLTKQIDAINTASAATIKSAEARMDRVSDRITVIESKATGHGESWGFFVGAIGIVMAGLSAFAMFQH